MMSSIFKISCTSYVVLFDVPGLSRMMTDYSFIVLD